MIFENHVVSENEEKDTLISIIPRKMNPNPSNILPVRFHFLLSTINTMIAPKKIRGNAISSTPIEMMKARTVVPICAPIIIGRAFLRSINPAVISPTTITVVAEEDWIAIVTSTPTSNPLSGWSVAFPIIVFSLDPARDLSDELIKVSPYRKIPSPPIIIKRTAITVVSFRSIIESKLFI